MELNWFTIYHSNGNRSVICGDFIDNAYKHAGYTDSDIKAMEWHDEGVTETHWYDKEKKQWVKFRTLIIHINDITAFDPNEITKLLNKFNTIIIDYSNKHDNKNKLVLEQKWGLFYISNQSKSAYVKYISIGSYNGEPDDEEDSHHYQMSNTQYFSPDNIPKVAEIFLTGGIKTPFMSTADSETIDEIFIKQKIDYEM